MLPLLWQVLRGLIIFGSLEATCSGCSPPRSVGNVRPSLRACFAGLNAAHPVAQHCVLGRAPAGQVLCAYFMASDAELACPVCAAGRDMASPTWCPTRGTESHSPVSLCRLLHMHCQGQRLLPCLQPRTWAGAREHGQCAVPPQRICMAVCATPADLVHCSERRARAATGGDHTSSFASRLP